MLKTKTSRLGQGHEQVNLDEKRTFLNNKKKNKNLELLFCARRRESNNLPPADRISFNKTKLKNIIFHCIISNVVNPRISLEMFYKDIPLGGEHFLF